MLRQVTAGLIDHAFRGCMDAVTRREPVVADAAHELNH
jgi:hypothetical protein